MNVGMHVSFQIIVSSGYMLRSRIAASYIHYIFIFWPMGFCLNRIILYFLSQKLKKQICWNISPFCVLVYILSCTFLEVKKKMIVIVAIKVIIIVKITIQTFQSLFTGIFSILLQTKSQTRFFYLVLSLQDLYRPYINHSLYSTVSFFHTVFHYINLPQIIYQFYC